jgi:hypothetical protein
MQHELVIGHNVIWINIFLCTATLPAVLFEFVQTGTLAVREPNAERNTEVKERGSKIVMEIIT